jgi:hypothetical protein
MDEWWSEIDDAVLACLREAGGTSPDEIGRRLGMSEDAAISILGMLAQHGRVRISRVEAVQGIPRERSRLPTEGSMAGLGVGDLVIRNHRVLKTLGTIVRAVPPRPGEIPQVWVKWDHADILPNPSREAADDLELVKHPDEPPAASRSATVL